MSVLSGSVAIILIVLAVVLLIFWDTWNRLRKIRAGQSPASRPYQLDNEVDTEDDW